MSPVIVDDIVIQPRYKGVEGMRNIRKVLHDLILTGIDKCLQAGIALARIIVPESAARPGRYGENYSSEKLMLAYIKSLTDTLFDLSVGQQSLKKFYRVEQKWRASYAEHVNFMPQDVDWSKKTSERKFIETLDDFLRGNMTRFIQRELDEGAPAGVRLRFTVS